MQLAMATELRLAHGRLPAAIWLAKVGKHQFVLAKHHNYVGQN